MRGAKQWLDGTGYAPEHDGVPVDLSGHTHMYTGETFGVRSRVIDHLFGNIRGSNFRLTVLAALWGSGFWGPAPGRFELQAREVWLTEFLSQRAGGGLRTRRLRQGQRAPIYLSTTPSPMNIEGRSRSSYAASLRQFRRAFKARPEVAELLATLPGPAYLAEGMVSRRPCC